jgi:hypothetical protein
LPVFLCSYSLGKMAFEAAAMRRQWPLQAWDMGPCAWRLPGLPQLVMRAEPPAQVANSVVGGPPGLRQTRSLARHVARCAESSASPALRRA